MTLLYGGLLISEVESFLAKMKDHNCKAIAGATFPGYHLASATCCYSFKTDWQVNALLIRPETKDHGACGRVEGPLGEKRVALIMTREMGDDDFRKCLGAVRSCGLDIGLTLYHGLS